MIKGVQKSGVFKDTSAHLSSQNAIRSTDIPGEAKLAMLGLLVERQIILQEGHVFKLMKKMIKR
jgi:hypothetical protein